MSQVRKSCIISLVTFVSLSPVEASETAWQIRAEQTRKSKEELGSFDFRGGQSPLGELYEIDLDI